MTCMHQDEDGTRTYSHTSLSLWRLCKRKWYYRYILKHQIVMSIQAIFSIHLVHKPLAAFFGGVDVEWEKYFADFQKKIGADVGDALHTIAAGQQILEHVQHTPPLLQNIKAEPRTFYHFKVAHYTSRPDLVGFRDELRFTVDWKYTESKWKTDRQPWPVKELLPYDDQLLGQAICAEADGFIRGIVRCNPKSGQLADVVYQEQLVDDALREEWLSETEVTICEAEQAIATNQFPKNEDACFAFGRPCEFIAMCKRGIN